MSNLELWHGRCLVLEVRAAVTNEEQDRWMMSAVPMTVDRLVAERRIRLVTVTALGWVIALLAGAIVGVLSLTGHPTGVLLIGGLTLPIVIWKWPQVSVVLVMLVASLIEQNPVDPFPLRSLPLPLYTDQFPVFQSLSDSAGLSGLLINPVELVIILTLVVWLMRSIADRSLRLPSSYLGTGLLGLFALALFAAAHGLLHGADFREALRELRPFVYLAAFYLLASQLLTGHGRLRALLWIFTLGTGIKGLQGTAEFLAVRGNIVRPEAVLAHEEAVFLGVFLMMTAALWLFDGPSRLRRVATALTPFVLVADIANDRRAAWLILATCAAALVAVAGIRLRRRRARILGASVLAVGVIAVYVPLFWNGNGGLSQPARAIRSMVIPDSRDFASNLYRQQENANLQFNIQQSMPQGAGFGIPIDYALPIVDLTATTPSLKFVPHNTILYVWLRMGLLGMLAFWFVVGAAMLAAARLVRSPDRRAAVLGTVAIAAVIAYVLEGYYDLGLSWFRLGVFMGCVLGALEAARRLTPVGAEQSAAGVSASSVD